MLLELRQETKAHFLVGKVILGFLSIFKKCQASSPFETFNSVCLSRYQSDVIPPIKMRRRTMAFSRASTGDSDIPSSCEMKHEPEFKPLQGNPASSPSEGYVSWDFSSCGRNVGYILELERGWPFETPLCSAKSGLLCSYEGHLRNLN